MTCKAIEIIKTTTFNLTGNLPKLTRIQAIKATKVIKIIQVTPVTQVIKASQDTQVQPIIIRLYSQTQTPYSPPHHPHHTLHIPNQKHHSQCNLFNQAKSQSQGQTFIIPMEMFRLNTSRIQHL